MSIVVVVLDPHVIMDTDRVHDALPGVASATTRASNLLFHSPERTLTKHDNNLHPRDSEYNDGSNNSLEKSALINRIESIFESIADCILAEGKELVIPLKSRQRQGGQVHDLLTGTIVDVQDTVTRDITFPGKTPHEAWKFSKYLRCQRLPSRVNILYIAFILIDLVAALLRILELSHEALVSGTVTTKRLVSLFPSIVLRCKCVNVSGCMLPLYGLKSADTWVYFIQSPFMGGIPGH